MGTSNWQNIPFCVEVLRAIEPRRVLDVGVGFGRWGMLVHEFCDVWAGRILPADWKVSVQGIEAFPANVTDYHHHFYDTIHLGDASEVLPALRDHFDLSIYGDVLEHFEKAAATRLLERSLERSDYVLINLPLGEHWEQDELYGNPYERHLSAWEAEEFQAFGLVREARFSDYEGRPFGCFVLSRSDPRDLAHAPGLATSAEAGQRSTPTASAADLAERLRHAEYELQFLQQARPIRKLLREPGKLVQSLGRFKKEGIEVRALGQAGPAASGCRVVLLGALSETAPLGVPWNLIAADQSWVRRRLPGGCLGAALAADEAARLRCVVRGKRPRLRFATGPDAGQVEVRRRGQREVLDLYAPAPGVLEHRFDEPVGTASPAVRGPAPAPDQGDPVCLTVAGWLGVSSATRQLFPHCREHAEPLKAAARQQLIHELDAQSARHVVLSGGSESQLKLAQELHRHDPDRRIDVLWFGSYLQVQEDAVWDRFQALLELAREGVVTRIGVAKKGMETWLQGQGISAHFVASHVQQIPAAASTPDSDEPVVGLWLSGENYRKPSYAMLAAVALLPGWRLRAAGLSPRALDFARLQEIPTDWALHEPLDREHLAREIPRTHVTLYTTLSECSPMLPLESLSLGVPCLLGPTSHLFEDHEYLHSRLVVPSPDRADVIAEHLQRAVLEREQIVAAYRDWAVGYRRLAEKSLREFLAQ